MRGDEEKSPFIRNDSDVMEIAESGSLYGSVSAEAAAPSGIEPETPEKESGLAEDGPASESSADLTLTTTTATLMNLVRGFTGPGMLGQASAVRNAGLAVGSAGLLFIGALSTHCRHILVRSANIICKRTGKRTPTYAEVGELCLATGPRVTRRFATTFRHTITGFVTATQLGIISVLISFIAENVQQVVNASVPGAHLSQAVYKSVVALCLVPMGMVRNLRLLAPFSALANFMTFVSVIIIFVYVLPDLPDVSQRPLTAPLSRFPLFIGTACFSFESISQVMPNKNKMKHPEDFDGCSGVLTLSSAVSVCLNVALGFYGYLKFGDDVKGSITLNLPSDDWLCQLTKMLVAVSVFIAYNVQLYVLVYELWPVMAKRLKSDAGKLRGEIAFRIALIIITYGVSMLVSRLDLMLSLIGSLSGMALTFCFPALIELLALLGMEPGEVPPEDACVSCRPCSTSCQRPAHSHHYLSKVKAVAILLLSIFGVVAGTYSSISAIVDAFGS